MPPATWVPHDEWLPDPDWPEPPPDWTFWSATTPQQAAGASGAGDGVRTGGRGSGSGGRPGRVSFPIATVAAQSTVSLAALFPDRGRAGGTTNGGYGSSAGAVAGVRGATGPTKAGREYYQPRSERSASTIQVVGGGGPGGSGGPDGSGPGGSVLDGAGGVLVDIAETSAGGAAGPESSGSGTSVTEAQETAKTPGIRLSPILRLVAHPSGLRAQFRVGGPVAAALADVMTPAIEAATPGLARVGVDERDFADRAGGDGPGRRGGGLRRLLGPRRNEGRSHQGPGAGVRSGSGGGPDDGQASAGVLSIHELARRALAARRDADRDEALAVERDLCSLHRHGFTAIHPPAVEPFAPVSAAEESAIRGKVLAATGATAKGLSRTESAELKALAAERAAAVVRASNVARRVFADRRTALATGAWQLLEAHDPAAVVAVVDEALRRSGSDVTCLDAGTDPVTRRGYVTVLVRFPTIGIVAEEQRAAGPSGRAAWRPRTARERNAVYAAGLASAVLAAAKHVVTIAPATDDVNVVVVRPTRNGRGVEPVYVGRLDREDVSLRHPDADPGPLVRSSAVPHGIRVHGPDREVTALEHVADVDGALREIVDACRAADARGRTGPGA
ncbi:hypothetical protein [Terrabacter sp. C0L_2]|uniref:hypothetical protein n=1 Tax=Terrabacter sp. C0L_2 TaxID=3108389 RepID=UPI002ED335C0|nr:hypothetical protein U5C87_03730 [Terrabacter sp. C0L_2]